MATRKAFLLVLILAACSRSEAKSPANSPEPPLKMELKDRLDEAAELLAEFRGRVASPVVKRARCVAVVPAILKGGFIVGARHGSGFATCRVASGWSAPAPITISGASAGLQIGVQSVDLLMLVMTEAGMKRLLRTKFTLGADMSVSAGPVGKGSEGDTDAALKTEALSYSRSRGLFAGVELNGASVQQDVDAMEALYGQRVEFQRVLMGELPVPPEAQRFISSVGETF